MRNILVILLLLVLFATPALAEVEYISPTGVSQRTIVKHLYEAEQNQLYKMHTTAGLAQATEDVNLVNAATFIANGVFGTTTQGEIRLTGDAQAASTTRLYLIVYDATNSTAEVVVGADNVTDIGDVECTENHVPVGYVKVVTDSTHTFTPGTTSLSAAGITTTFYNLGAKPARVRVLKNSR